MRTVDETGLCAEDCHCARCEAGYKPTPLERATARRALEAGRYFERKRQEREARRVKYQRHPPPPPLPVPPPLTEEQRAELAKLREDFRRKGP